MYKFIIDSNLPTFNEYSDAERTNRYLAANMKKRFTEICSKYALNLPKNIPGRYDVFFRFYRANKEHDTDNIYFGKKFILDGLVKAGVIKTDGQSTVRWHLDLIFQSQNKKNFVVVLLFPTETSPLNVFDQIGV